MPKEENENPDDILKAAATPAVDAGTAAVDAAANGEAEPEPAIPAPTAEQKQTFAQIFRRFVKPRANPAPPQQPV